MEDAMAGKILVVDDDAANRELLEEFLVAKGLEIVPAPDGRIGHAELQFGDSVVMLSDEYPEMGVKGPKSLGGTPVTLSVYVEDVDAVFGQAVQAGASALRQPENQFYGDRSGQFEDPFGHRWSVATHVEDVSPDEMARRAAEAMGG